jgi:hypothetical protein
MTLQSAPLYTYSHPASKSAQRKSAHKNCKIPLSPVSTYTSGQELEKPFKEKIRARMQKYFGFLFSLPMRGRNIRGIQN